MRFTTMFITAVCVLFEIKSFESSQNVMDDKGKLKNSKILRLL